MTASQNCFRHPTPPSRLAVPASASRLPVAAIEYFVAAQDSEERIRAALEMLKNKPAPAPRILASALQGLTVQERRNAMADLMQVKEPPDKTFLFRHSVGRPPLIWVQPDNRSLADIAKDMSAGQIREDFRNILHSRGGYGTCFAARVVAHVILLSLQPFRSQSAGHTIG